jgi:signal transduction histidine kinase
MEREFGKVDGQTCYEYMEGSGTTICSRCRNGEVFEGKSFIQEWESPKNNKVYDCFDTPITLVDGVQCKLRIMHDITGLKKAESELKAKHEQIQQLSSELLTAQESERLRISRELHDELGQSLTLIKLKIGLVKMDLPESPQSLKNMCDDASKHVDQAIENMRRLSRDLSPVTIETLGVTRALRRLTEDFGKTGKIQITAEIDDIDDLLPMQSSILLYRILQEGLNNIVKHSGAGTVNVMLKKTDKRIQFNLQDDGRGVDFGSDDREANAEKGGLGLTIMSERVRTLGGALLIQRLNDAGTRIGFAIPIRDGEIGNGELSGDSGR